MRINDLQIGLERSKACRYDDRQYGFGVLYVVLDSLPDHEPLITPLSFRYDIAKLQHGRFDLTVANVMDTAHQRVAERQKSDERRLAIAKAPVVGFMLAQMCGKTRHDDTGFHGMERLAAVIVGDISAAKQVYDVSRGIASPDYNSTVRPSRIKHPNYIDTILHDPNIVFNELPLTPDEAESLTVSKIVPVFSRKTVSWFGLKRSIQAQYVAIHNVTPETDDTVETVVDPDQINSFQVGKILC